MNDLIVTKVMHAMNNLDREIGNIPGRERDVLSVLAEELEAKLYMTRSRLSELEGDG